MLTKKKSRISCESLTIDISLSLLQIIRLKRQRLLLIHLIKRAKFFNQDPFSIYIFFYKILSIYIFFVQSQIYHDLKKILKFIIIS